MTTINENNKRNNDIIDQADSLFDYTISDALQEDFEFRSFDEAKLAIKTIIDRLNSLTEDSFSYYEDEDEDE